MRNSTRLLLSVLSLSVPLLGGACNVTARGDRGIVGFTPDECGMLICSLGNDLAAGASIEVSLSAPGLTLRSDDESVAIVNPAPFDRFEVIAVGSGSTSLVAYDHGNRLDRTKLSVAQPARYGVIIGSDGVLDRGRSDDAHETWVVPAQKRISFDVRPFDSFGGELMGKLNLETAIDQDLYDSLGSPASLPEGLISLSMTPGEHGMSVSAHGVSLDILFDAR